MSKIKVCNSIMDYINIRKSKYFNFEDVKFKEGFDYEALFNYAKGEKSGIGMLILADCYNYGLGVEIDKEIGKNYEIDCIKLKYSFELMKYGRLLLEYDDFECTDIALKAFKEALKLGNIDAYDAIGDCYYMPWDDYENDVESDINTALTWYKKSAKEGNIDSIIKIAQIYENPIYDCYNNSEAIKWYKKGAKLGNKKCMKKVGR